MLAPASHSIDGWMDGGGESVPASLLMMGVSKKELLTSYALPLKRVRHWRCVGKRREAKM